MELMGLFTSQEVIDSATPLDDVGDAAGPNESCMDPAESFGGYGPMHSYGRLYRSLDFDDGRQVFTGATGFRLVLLSLYASLLASLHSKRSKRSREVSVQSEDIKNNKNNLELKEQTDPSRRRSKEEQENTSAFENRPSNKQPVSTKERYKVVLAPSAYNSSVFNLYELERRKSSSHSGPNMGKEQHFIDIMSFSGYKTVTFWFTYFNHGDRVGKRHWRKLRWDSYIWSLSTF